MSMVIRSWRLGGDGSPGIDPYFANTVLLLSGDGANGSVTFPDESFVARGNAGRPGTNDSQVTTAVKKFGTGSIRFDGSADSATHSDSADWHFASSAFTIETWVLFDPAGIETTQTLVCHWDTPTQRSWALQYTGGAATNTLNFLASFAGSAVDLNVSFNWTPTADTFYHVAVDRSGNVFRLYIDGAMVATATDASALHNSTTTLRIAFVSSGGIDTSYFHGNLDELRITKGVARYASDGGYSVPTTAFPRS